MTPTLRSSKLLVSTVLLIVMMTADGCSLSVLSPNPDTSKYYVLTPVSAPTASAGPVASSANSLAVGVGPVKTPEYLDRPEVVSRSSSNQLVLSTNERWAESVDRNFTAVLAQDLSTLLNSNQILTFPWYRPAHIQYQVRVDVDRFDTDSDGTGRLIGRWEIRDVATGETLYSAQADIRQPHQAGESQAATLSAAIGQLSQQVADAIQSVRARPAHPRPTSSDAVRS